MDQDVEMDAPEISTLREESTPPPSKASSNPGFRLKLVVKDKTKTIASSSAGRQYGDEDDGDEEDEDQEDQLIDDEDAPIPSTALGGQGSTSSKRKAAASSTQPKRKSRKSENGKKASSDGVEGRGKLKEKVLQQPGAPNLAPTMTTFQANPATEPDEDPGADGQVHINIEEPNPPSSVSSPGSGKKKAAAKKAPATKKAKAGPSKLKLLPPMLPLEDSGIVSEGMTGTAASSPAGLQIDESYSPEPEGGSVPIELGSDAPSALHPVPPAEEPINLEGVPVPVYPLPTKPFPVLPPPKISSGFAPTIPLDKTKAQPRRWRVANREIRGIAGGRWFVRAWVGEKESEFANAMQAQKATAEGGLGGIGTNGLALPKLAGVSISAPQGTSSGKGSKKKTANSSRSGSSVPEHVNGVGSVSARGPSKMRISQMAPPPPSSEAGDIESLGS